VLEADAKDPKTRDTLRDATGVWFVAGTKPPVPAGGKRLVAGLSGAAAAGDALGLLPGAVIDPEFRADSGDRLFEALGKAPGSFGVGVGEKAALVVRGRRMAVVGDGTVTVCLAKCEAKPRRVIELTEKNPSDYTMLRRAAIARAGAPFPPMEPPAAEVPHGALVIVGGGGMPADVTQKFIELAGGPDAHIVVLPTANPGGPAEGGFLKAAGAKNVVSLPAVKLEEVEDPKNLDELRKADAIWFGGGRQWHFVDAYEGTKAIDLFRDVLRRGGVIGGSSAGATIQGDYLCRGSPLNNTDEICEGYERGFAFLPGVAIDQHFAQRNRFADMTALMKTYPQLLGVGLDEATAIVVRGHEADVMGEGEAHFYDRKKPPADGQPDYESVKAGGRYDLKARKVVAAGG
jgi:cyanophycinase